MDVAWIRPNLGSVSKATIQVLDQTKLPGAETWVTLSTCEQVADAIRRNVVMGSSAIGILAAFGLALGARGIEEHAFEEEWNHLCANMVATRPTAPDLFRCIEQMKRTVTSHRGTHGALIDLLHEKAAELLSARTTLDRLMGEMGEGLIEGGMRVLLHGNSGALGTGGYGTALGLVKTAVSRGKTVKVIIAEARPDMQGGRVCAWEAASCGLSTSVCVDAAVGHVVTQDLIDVVVVEAQKVAANGDVAANIGVFTIAAVCQHHNIPFYVVAPMSVVDVSVPSAKFFLDEKKAPMLLKEVSGGRGTTAVKVVPDNVAYINPASDRTPAEMVTAFITEEGVLTPDESGSFVDTLREKLTAYRAARTN